MDSTDNDSFEQFLNQFVPVNQRWFSSDRARPGFRPGAVSPKRQTSAQLAVALKGQYARILAIFRSWRLRKFGPVGRSAQPVLSLDILKSRVVWSLPRLEIVVWINWHLRLRRVYEGLKVLVVSMHI